MDEGGPLDAGSFSSWLTQMRDALAEEGASDVPCGTCTACCTSSQFVHVGPDESDTLAAIPAELLFPAPGLPAGHRLLGYDEQGRCPMLVDGACSIYARRPRTCRTYDCRVFAASGVDPTEDDKPLIAARAGRWRFAHPTPDDQRAHDAVRAAATYLQAPADELPAELVASSATRRAVLAVEIHERFLTTGRPQSSRASSVTNE